MGLIRSLAMLVLILPLFWFPQCSSQSSKSARGLDVLLQGYAYRAFVRPRTGIPFDGDVPSNLTGVTISAMRLRSGSLRTRGVKMYKEFQIPTGVVVSPYVERLVLVYQNLGNWSYTYYPIDGYTYLTPVIGLLAYDALNLSATNLPELDVRASGKSISIIFSDVKSVSAGLVAKCVWFDLHGSVSFTNVGTGNVCSTTEQGHFSIVVESIAPSPSPNVSPVPGPTPETHVIKEEKGSKSLLWIILGSVVGGVVLLVLLGFLILCLYRYNRQKKFQGMERAADGGEALKMTTVGNTKAPAARMTRTQPSIEKEYVP